MNYENYFRIHRQSVLENFIISFVGNNDLNKFYSPANLPTEWIPKRNNEKVVKISDTDYEKTLVQFFENPELIDSKHPLLVILGSIGTGKSTTVNYALDKANICQDCDLISTCDKDYPHRVLIDFIGFSKGNTGQIPAHQQNNETIERENNFWFHILNVLDNSIKTTLNIETEVSTFWLWLLKSQKNAIPQKIYLKLEHKSYLLDDPVNNANELLKLRDELYAGISRKDRVYYKLFIIRYLRREKIANCNLLVFDNIDTLEPYLQDYLIKFAVDAFRNINCRSILPMRPHTYSTIRNSDASNFQERIPHHKPSLSAVFENRLNNYKEVGNKDVAVQLEKLINIIKRNRIFKEIFLSTSGRSLRYAFRNFYNFSLSPLIVTHSDSTLKSNIDLDTNTFFQAYFCSENKDQLFDDSSYCNLLSVTRSRYSKYASNIKLRILHLLKNNNSFDLGELVSVLRSFGYKSSEIHIVINELLDFRKALIWSSAQNSYRKSELKSAENHVIQITHLGLQYFERLVSQPMYLRECIYSIDDTRIRRKSASIARVIQVIQDLEYQDFNEVENFLNKKDLAKYEEYFPTATNSISKYIWLKVRDNLQNWIGTIEETKFEYDRNYFIDNRLNQIKLNSIK